MTLPGQALSDKRLIAKARAEKGRWVDYIIEFARSIDNLVGYHRELTQADRAPATPQSRRLDYYFDVFLQQEKAVSISDYVKEIERYNQCMRQYGNQGEKCFFADVEKQYPEFAAVFEKCRLQTADRHLDLIQYLLRHSPFLNADRNKWMQPIIEVVRKTSLFFQPQIRTKIMNEGWASYWHETLFQQDNRINGHEVDFAKANAGVTTLPRVGLNPYALGMRLFFFIEELADRGKYAFDFQRLSDSDQRKRFDRKTGRGRRFIFQIREKFF